MVLENEKIMNGKYQASFLAIVIGIYLKNIFMYYPLKLYSWMVLAIVRLTIVKLDGFSYSQTQYNLVANW